MLVSRSFRLFAVGRYSACLPEKRVPTEATRRSFSRRSVVNRSVPTVSRHLPPRSGAEPGAEVVVPTPAWSNPIS
ncbi:hypothetical protein BRC79_10335 [Halobacteriales archaeon QH_8_67_27]|nr:MAG: hypothetical protein BRC79_10335 [Halobacteriales archaeon QH_8_67_27]